MKIQIEESTLKLWLEALKEHENPLVSFTEDHEENFKKAFERREELIAPIRKEISDILIPF